MTGVTYQTEGDGKTHSVRELGLTSISNQRVTVINAPYLITGVAPGGASNPIAVGQNALELSLAPGAAYTYHHSDPIEIVFNDGGNVLAFAIIWSPDAVEGAVKVGPV